MVDTLHNSRLRAKDVLPKLHEFSTFPIVTSDLLYLSFGLGFLCFNCDHDKEEHNLSSWKYQRGSDIINVLFAYDMEKQNIFKEECTQNVVN